MGIGEDLLGLATWASDRLLQRVEGLTDAEFLWEPAPGAWTVRTLPISGRTVVDHSYYVPTPPEPVTTIGWRIAHLIDIYGSPRNQEWLGVTVDIPPPGTLPWAIAPTADASIALLRTAVEHFKLLLPAVAEERWLVQLGSLAGPYAESSLLAFVHHQLDEAIHHGAEVGLLRDLYAARLRDEPAEPRSPAEAADAGRWDLVEAMVDAGADVDANIEGRTALHQAAAEGDLTMVRFLVEHGASTAMEDPVWHLPPIGWAQFFNRREVVEYLRPSGAAEC